MATNKNFIVKNGLDVTGTVTANTIAVSNTSLVSNLNADMLEGQHGSYYTANSIFAAHTSNTSNPHSVTATQVGLGNVTNESKATMFSSPTFTGTPVAPTATSGTNTTQVATTAFVQARGIAAEDMALAFSIALG